MSKIAKLERDAERFNRQLIAIIDKSESGAYIALGNIGREFEQLSREELAALKAKRGEALLVVHMEPEITSKEQG